MYRYIALVCNFYYKLLTKTLLQVHVPYKDSYSPHPHSSRADSKKTLPAVSLPVTVTVHGSQSSAAEATIFWDNSFAPRNRDSFAHPGAQPWGELKVLLVTITKLQIRFAKKRKVFAIAGMIHHSVNNPVNHSANSLFKEPEKKTFFMNCP